MFWGIPCNRTTWVTSRSASFSRGREFRQGDEMDHLRESVDHGQDGVVALGGRETGDKVKGNV